MPNAESYPHLFPDRAARSAVHMLLQMLDGIPMGLPDHIARARILDNNWSYFHIPLLWVAVDNDITNP
eukprot:9480372-Pyramimonas_sp.AAC.1